MNIDDNLVESTRKILLTASVMLATLLFTIDSTVANVALPVLQGNLSATREQSSWVLTSYLIASAVALPTLAAIEARLGLRRAYLLGVFGFGISSVLCALAPNIEALVVARFIQGLCGSILLPLGQTALQTVFPRHLLSRAFSLLGIGVMLGPVVGPTLGGWLTDNFGWRSVFFINIPFVILSFIGLWTTLRGAPLSKPRPFDILGFIFLALAMLSLQLALDRGEQLGWFDSVEIVLEAFIGTVATFMFITHLITTRVPLFSASLVRNRNLVVSIFLSMLVGWGFMGSMVLLPQFLQEIQGYSVVGAGILLAPRGIGLIIAMGILSRYASFLDPRHVFTFGCIVNSLGLLAFSFAPADAPPSWLVGWLLLQGIGLGLIFVPLNAVGFSTLQADYRTEGAALITLARNLGGSIGVAFLVQGISHDEIANTQRLIEIAHYPSDTVWPNTFLWFLGEVRREALVISYSNQYGFLTFLPFLMIPFIWLTQPSVFSEKLSNPDDSLPPSVATH